ncbi:MAG: ABC transporter permease [Clostridiales Family XIII bacterium]|jgi:simple sugar transport system permease protein|nr:ABC transporter permease [Clostridiales Family XIII bacterium]
MGEQAVITRLPEPTFKQKIARSKIEISIGIVTVGVFLVYLIGAPQVFTHYQIYYSFMTTIPITGILALALTFVITLGEIDMSFPSVMALGGLTMSTVYSNMSSVDYFGIPPLTLGILAGLGVGILCGLLNSLLIVGFGIPSIVGSIGTQFFFRGLVNVIAAGAGISMLAAQSGPESGVYFALAGKIQVTEGARLPMQFLWFIGLGVLCLVIAKRHRFGLHVSFVGDNKLAAQMMGVNVPRVRITAYVITGLAAAFAGIVSNLEVAYFYPSQGEDIMLPALAAVFIGGTSVLGGRGSVVGTFLGALIMGSLEAGIISLGFDGFWTKVFYGLIIMVSVSVYSFVMKKST